MCLLVVQTCSACGSGGSVKKLACSPVPSALELERLFEVTCGSVGGHGGQRG